MQINTDNNFIDEILICLKKNKSAVMATVVNTRGSTPRKAGAKMLIRPDGSFTGTIGGGCGEAEVWQKAMEVFKSNQLSYVSVDLTEPVDGEDKVCGGVMDVMIEKLVP
ncbi:MAG: xanthine dehydrogenase accessory factor [Chloroflexi bacterium]|jgi:xanthine/CO dehydrogenase XdhC/CoxF family maturation factor|nr:MAG: xanthine dehydrogenase accessory factor [Chloroflexota bacterium]|tara:strand:+ start:1641 stop:1967 length:327 start_codon:yes stop_codon:yes gene_type:complete